MAIAYYDGQFVARESITVNPADFGFARGVALFELARVYGGVPLYLEAHLQRLARGAALLGIAMPEISTVARAARTVIGRNAYPHSAIKFYLTAGECGSGSHSYSACDDFTPHLMIFEDGVTPQHPEAPYGLAQYQAGQRLKIVPYEREMPDIKSINYLTGFYAARQVAGAAWDDILFTHRDGFITEATKSNVFCVLDGVLVTPRRGMLLGITRQIVLELAGQLGIPVAERDLFPAEIARATEAFTTGSIAELMPVRQINDHVMPTTMEGPVFAALRQGFSAKIMSLEAEN